MGDCKPDTGETTYACRRLRHHAQLQDDCSRPKQVHATAPALAHLALAESSSASTALKHQDSSESSSDATGAWLACLAVAAVAGAALMFAFFLREVPEARMINVFLWFQRTFEPVPLMVTLAFVVALAVALVRGRSAPPHLRATALVDAGGDVSPQIAWLLGAVVTLVTFAITHRVMHAYALSGDEWSASFQARIFARGMIAAPVPVEWRPWAPVMVPAYIRYDASSGTWESLYLPVHALIRSLFVRAGAETLANPLLAGLTVVGLAGIARRLWPREGRMQWLALGALVTSAQFLLMSGTAYAMPAHLCLNTWWLWCWLRREESRWNVGALPVIGVAALGLHQVVPHALFVAPFLVRLLLEKRWERTIGVGAAYALGCVGWLGWMARVGATQGYGFTTFFAFPDAKILHLDIQNLALVATWQAPLVAATAVCGLLRLRYAPPVLRDLAAGLILTMAVYAMFRFDQQHGWGYRYAYATLGNVVLVSAYGARWLARYLRASDGCRLCTGSFVVAVVILFPLRAWQAEGFVRPFARAAAAIETSREEVVLVNASLVWYGTDFIRNAPFQEAKSHVVNVAGPLVSIGITPPSAGRSVRVMTPDDFRRLGVPYRDMRFARPQLP